MKPWMPLLALFSVGAMPARGQGVVIGPDGRLATLLLQAHRVDATVYDQVAVQRSQSIRQMQEAGRAAAPPRADVTVVAGRTLARDATGARVDAGFDAAAGLIRLRFASEACFTFLRRYPEARAFAKLGDRVTFFFRGRYVRIGPEGPAVIDEQVLKTWFG